MVCGRFSAEDKHFTMDRPTLIKSRVSTGTIWIEERDIISTDEVIVRFPKREPRTDLEKTALLFAVAFRQERAYRSIKIVGPLVTSPEVVQHLRITGKLSE